MQHPLTDDQPETKIFVFPAFTDNKVRSHLRKAPAESSLGVQGERIQSLCMSVPRQIPGQD